MHIIGVDWGTLGAADKSIIPGETNDRRDPCLSVLSRSSTKCHYGTCHVLSPMQRDGTEINFVFNARRST